MRSGGTLLIEADTLYFRGKDERTQAINLEPWSTDVVYNLWVGSDNYGQVRVSSSVFSDYFYLKDHLGDIRMTMTSGGAIDAYNNGFYPAAAGNPFGEQQPGMNGTGQSDGRYKLRHP